MQQHTALYSIMVLYGMAAGGLVRATKRKAPSVFGSKEANVSTTERLLQNHKQLLLRLQLSTRRAAAGITALAVADEDITAARSQPCAGYHQLYA
jgi:hypothetical protein